MVAQSARMPIERDNETAGVKLHQSWTWSSTYIAALYFSDICVWNIDDQQYKYPNDNTEII